VLLGERRLGVVTVNAVWLVGLRPDRDYPVRIARAGQRVCQGDGLALAPAGSDLLFGVGATRYRDSRILVRQAANQRRYQSWTMGG
jgi:hypothetical protein